MTRHSLWFGPALLPRSFAGCGLNQGYAGRGNRTPNLPLTRRLLCQLSYSGILIDLLPATPHGNRMIVTDPGGGKQFGLL